ncbi:MAG TPA: RNA 2',3'-cyclic phosphodiesterase [Acidimicrobiales bacterium]|nr:RNA 2',3'-cyclic phosphodiesterase [Acidimicrobiales bacterium]
MRAFVAVWSPPEVVASLSELARPEVEGLRWTGPDQWHVTLRFLGEVDEDEAASAFGTISAGSPVVAEMGPATGRFGRRVLHVPVSGLDDLAAATVAATAGIGQPPEHRRFVGHITLARARHPRGVDLRPLAGASIAGRWVVPEITLVASRLGAGPDGRARYDIVRRLPLALQGP